MEKKSKEYECACGIEISFFNWHAFTDRDLKVPERTRVNDMAWPLSVKEKKKKKINLKKLSVEIRKRQGNGGSWTLNFE